MANVNDVDAIRLVMALSTILLFGSIWCGIVAFLRAKKMANLVYLLCFTVFYIYLYKVLDYTLFQFQSLLVLKHFLPNLILNGVTGRESINLIPLVTLTIEDLKTSLLNILLMIPLGFGLAFLTTFGITRIVAIGGLFSIAIELLQLATGLLAGVTFRIADINDVVFNTAGVAVGYVLFAGLVRVSARASRNWNLPAHSRAYLDTAGYRARDRS
jgi:glycopeptide antibiotics resistance protein